MGGGGAGTAGVGSPKAGQIRGLEGERAPPAVEEAGKGSPRTRKP